MDEAEYKLTLNISGHKLDGEDVVYSLVRHMGLPLLLLTISEVTTWKELLHGLMKVREAKKWSADIRTEHDVDLDPRLDLRAQHRGEYLEWVPDEVPENGKEES
jgi:hypothetical protein